MFMIHTYKLEGDDLNHVGGCGVVLPMLAQAAALSIVDPWMGCQVLTTKPLNLI